VTPLRSALVEGELAGPDVGVRGEHATARHELHEIGAPLGALPDRPAQPLDAAHRAAHRCAVTADAGDRRAGRDDGGAARVLAVPVDHGPLVVAEVAHRRHAGGELGRERRLDGRVELAAQAGQPVERVGLVVAAEVAVGVDQLPD